MHPPPPFPTALFRIGKMWKQSRCPAMDRWIKSRWYIHTTGNDSAVKRERNLAVYDNMDGHKGIMLSEIHCTENIGRCGSVG